MPLPAHPSASEDIDSCNSPHSIRLRPRHGRSCAPWAIACWMTYSTICLRCASNPRGGRCRNPPQSRWHPRFPLQGRPADEVYRTPRRTPCPLHDWQSSSAGVGMGTRHWHAAGDACRHACLRPERARGGRPPGSRSDGGDVPALARRAHGHAGGEFGLTDHGRDHGQPHWSRGGPAREGRLRRPQAGSAGLYVHPQLARLWIDRDALLGAEGSRVAGPGPRCLSPHPGDGHAPDRFRSA